jgi:hypothetical protein
VFFFTTYSKIQPENAPSTPTSLLRPMESSKIYDQVREHYSSASRGTSVKYGEAVAKSFGYSAEELADIPKDANLGLSCGNPLAIASLQEASHPPPSSAEYLMLTSKIG